MLLTYYDSAPNSCMFTLTNFLCRHHMYYNMEQKELKA